ncbi:MAG: ABC transporter permease [Candidatus Hermodarchaeota archaeon]
MVKKSQTMLKYILKRILFMIPVLLLTLSATFVLTQLMAADPVLNKLGWPIDFEDLERERQRIGWYDPWYVKLGKYFATFFTGDWGTSYIVAEGMPVLTFIGKVYPKTIELVIIPIIVIPIIAVKLGVISAKHRNKSTDNILRFVWMLGAGLPLFYIGLMLQNFVGQSFDLEVMSPNSPTIRYPKPNWPFSTGFRLIDSIIFNDQVLLQDTILHLILPVICLTFVSLSGITRQTRASMLEIMEKDYIRTARAKGVLEKEVINKHALRNALIPTTTVIVGNTAALLTGALLLEMVFNYTGMGYYTYTAIVSGDYVVINGFLVFSVLIILVGNLVADIMYTIIDPRIAYK